MTNLPLLVLADPNNSTASGGFAGFVVFFLLAVAVLFLGRNLIQRLRRMNHRDSTNMPDAPSSTIDSTPPPGS